MSDINNVYLLFEMCAIAGRSIRLEYDNGKRIIGFMYPFEKVNPDRIEQGPAGYKVEISGYYAADVDDDSHREIIYPTLEEAVSAGFEILDELAEGLEDD